ncbi:molybdopterin-guanine dinucleotide biosynthesis protein B [Virgibacillus sp. YIM 98842]|uniref:molybdopterin-guanine dinucleotide biosynthesis protein B n=1 Tax=Virgibacillus sp. YIM 98842 TaxID=2663533 RepID=UPI0013DC89DB|nr:molybdopterin-guanine dinucleotide biosynthesis protein B [Virgibacillus sp. YIM 98842]
MHASKPFIICQIAGYKNAGKTTVIEKLIRYFTVLNKKTATLKHHGHGGEPKQVQGTDSIKHLEAGSSISGVQGEKQFQLSIADVSDFSLEKLISLYTFIPVDILLIEGFKQAGYPKIIVLKNEEDKKLLALSNIIAVIYWDEDILLSDDKKIFRMKDLDKELPNIAALILGLEEMRGI